MTCPQTLGPGLAGLSAAVQTGELVGTELFKAYCQACPEDVEDALLNAAVDAIDDKAMCQVMCCCKDLGQRQGCVRETLDAADELLGGQSRYKAEVSYNMMDVDGPSPFMHRDASGNDTTSRSHRWQTRAHEEIEGYVSGKGLVRRPDVVIVSDPTRPPIQDNIRRVVEMKFRGDSEVPGQYRAYEKIAGGADKFRLIKEAECRCDDDDRQLPDPIPVAVPQQEDAPSAWEIPVWAVVTAVGAVATAALALFPLDGPVGEAVAGTGTAAAAARLATAWRATFSAAPAAGALIR